MKSNYKPIGDYIRLVDERNKGLKVETLVGLSISKQFIKSVANTIGTDMENYKIIRKNQFACSTMQVRRDKKMPLALYTDFEPAIISQAYPVFEIIDEDILTPEYLMMWFTRSEFDREACFHAVGGVRGSLEWEDFCGMKLPVPSIEKQREIVNEYNVIQKRIELNNQLIQKLEDTAQTIYKQWFVEFEFPNEDGKPYKSNSGKMVWCEELEKEIPEGWSVVDLESIIDHKKGLPFKSKDYNTVGIPIVRVSDLTKTSINFKSCFCLNEKHIKNYTSIYLEPNDIIITSVGSWATNPDSVVGKVVKVPNVKFNSLLNQNMVRLRSKLNESQLILFTALSNKDFSEYTISGAQGSANQASVTLKHLFEYKLCFPKSNQIKLMCIVFKLIYGLANIKENEVNNLKEFKDLILSKMTKIENEITA